MAQPTATFLEELTAAIRGCIALITGRPEASSYFDFSQRGLIGSFIALLLGLAVQAFGSHSIGAAGASGAAGALIILGAIAAGVQFGVAWLVLRFLARQDGFIPFVVVQNWASLFQGLLAVGVVLVFGEPIAVETGTQTAQLTGGAIPFVVLGILALVISINTGRLILTLRPLHVGLFVVSQLTAVLLIQPILGAMLG